MAIALETIPQAGAISIHKGRICLVRSRSGKRWVIPKGCLERGKTAGQIALQEAWEEAGLAGVLKRQPLGSYLYEKVGNTYHVTVFVMTVRSVADVWPESDWRPRIWLPPAKAIGRVDDEGLRDLIDVAQDLI